MLGIFAGKQSAGFFVAVEQFCEHSDYSPLLWKQALLLLERALMAICLGRMAVIKFCSRAE